MFAGAFEELGLPIQIYSRLPVDVCREWWLDVVNQKFPYRYTRIAAFWKKNFEIGSKEYLRQRDK